MIFRNPYCFYRAQLHDFVCVSQKVVAGRARATRPDSPHETKPQHTTYIFCMVCAGSCFDWRVARARDPTQPTTQKQTSTHHIHILYNVCCCLFKLAGRVHVTRPNPLRPHKTATHHIHILYSVCCCLFCLAGRVRATRPNPPRQTKTSKHHIHFLYGVCCCLFLLGGSGCPSATVPLMLDIVA